MSKYSVGGITATERKVQITYTNVRGRKQYTSRWLSQVQIFADKVYDYGGSDVRFRLDHRHPWHAVQHS